MILAIKHIIYEVLNKNTITSFMDSPFACKINYKIHWIIKWITRYSALTKAYSTWQNDVAWVLERVMPQLMQSTQKMDTTKWCKSETITHDDTVKKGHTTTALTWLTALVRMLDLDNHNNRVFNKEPPLKLLFHSISGKT